MTKVFLLNGPASSGKDTLAAYIKGVNSTFDIDKMAYPLKLANKVLFSLTDEEFRIFDTDPKVKNTPQDRFFGKSWRQVNIDLSEKFIKTNYDMSFFGKSLVSRLKNNPKKRILVPDSGFLEEAMPLIQEFGAKNVHLIQLHREGFTFEGDSRAYIDLSEFGVKTHHLHNDILMKFEKDGERLIYSLTYD